MKAKISQIPNVLQNPAPDIEILDFNFAGTVLAVRPYCNNDHYWQVYFDANKTIRETFGEAGYPVPEYRYAISGLSSNGINNVIPPLSEILDTRAKSQVFICKYFLNSKIRIKK